MKSALAIIFILTTLVCFGQIKKDSIFKSNKDSLQDTKIFKEIQDGSYLKFIRFMQNNYFIFNATFIGSMVELPKPSLKEEIGKKQLTEKEIVQENLNKILAEIKVEVEDKRPWWLKILEGFLGIATKIAVVALAVGQLIK